MFLQRWIINKLNKTNEILDVNIFLICANFSASLINLVYMPIYI